MSGTKLTQVTKENPFLTSKVIRKPDYGSFILSPIPGEGEYTVSYDYYTTHTDLSAHGDNMGLPDRFSPLIIDRSKYYVYMLRSDPQHAQLADRDYQRKLKLLNCLLYTSPSTRDRG